MSLGGGKKADKNKGSDGVFRGKNNDGKNSNKKPQNI